MVSSNLLVNKCNRSKWKQKSKKTNKLNQDTGAAFVDKNVYVDYLLQNSIATNSYIGAGQYNLQLSVIGLCVCVCVFF